MFKKESLPKIIIPLAALLVLVGLIAFTCYNINADRWGAFGSYLGGILSTFTTIYLVITFQNQIEQNKADEAQRRTELENQKDRFAHEYNLKERELSNQKDQAIAQEYYSRKQLEIELEKIKKETSHREAVLNAQSLQIKKDEIQKRFALLLELYKSNIQELEVKDFQNNVIQGKKAVDAILSSFTIIFSSVKDFRKRGEKYSEDEKIADLSYAYEILYFGYHKQNIFRYLTESEWGEYSTNFSALPLHFIAEIQSSNDENKLFALYLYERFQNNAIDSANKSFDWLRSSHIHSFKGYHNDLGHYFRHAFNMVTYINEQKILTEEEQYDYVKLWRTQLTNNEQKLLFLNSFFKYGRDWEFAYRDYMESVDPLKSDHDYCLVTKYSLIKNLPNGEVFDGIIAGDFYPDIEFEND